MGSSTSPDASLLALPVELLRRIASHTTCSTVFNLFLTHRRLYAACNDRLVFRYIAETCHGIRCDEDIWRDSSALLDNATLADTIRVAFAVERALKLHEGEDPLLEIRPKDNGRYELDMHEWLPHLMALRHPQVVRLDPLPYLDIFYRTGPEGEGRWHQDVDDFDSTFTNVGFIILTSFLARRVTPGVLADDLQKYGNQHYLQLQDIPYGLSRQVPRPIVEYGVSLINFAQCSAICVTLAASIQLAFGNAQAILPSLDQMPLHEWAVVPPVYRSTIDTFATCHVMKMTEPDFLHGVWEGFYSDHRGWGGESIKIDPKMRDIQLIACPPTDSDYLDDADTLPGVTVVIDRNSGGLDKVGPFNLSGTVDEEGQVCVIKRYFHGGWTWRWRGRVMPYGIAGMWGRDLTGEFGGYFWIWKKEWAA
ncbi:hypothetical protein BDV96DRAFT_644807 [Lophiotrema nucula]|uniref:F-box domain-containing protein n=1 Tax=Lophiotrema nucula TaxID=690887 RepID=A0A6A5ZEM2_9PLEO|nr:hypothetical protein BDV96DRAFT_644807 [Lophiotrema nucula]